MKKTLKQIIKETPTGDSFYFFDSDLAYPSPDPETNENFIEDYQDNASNYNLYAMLKRGNQSLDIDEEMFEMLDVDNAADYTMALAKAVTDTHLSSWARLYYALSLAYNPLYNVDGTTTKTISQRERTDAYGAQSGGQTIGAVSTSDIHGAQSGSTIYGAVSESDIHGAKSATLGEHTDTQTNYSVSFDAATEKETGKTSNLLGAQTNTEATYTDSHTEQQRTDQTSSQSYTDSHTEQARSDSHQEAAHTDKHTDAEYTETEERKGNIGVTMSQQLLNAEWELRKKDFFATIINQMLDELGFMYIGGIEA